MAMPRPRNPNKELSPIAQFLYEFQLDQRPNWNRPQLADALGIPRTTVDGWFLHPNTAPKAPALYAISRLTNTPIEEVARLAGYREVPSEPDAGVWSFLEREIANEAELTPGERGKLKMLLGTWRARYEQPGVRTSTGPVSRTRKNGKSQLRALPPSEAQKQRDNVQAGKD